MTTRHIINVIATAIGLGLITGFTPVNAADQSDWLTQQRSLSDGSPYPSAEVGFVKGSVGPEGRQGLEGRATFIGTSQAKKSEGDFERQSRITDGTTE